MTDPASSRAGRWRPDTKGLLMGALSLSVVVAYGLLFYGFSAC